jgi:hypothetical protein
MKRITVMLAVLGGGIFFCSVDANAEDCPSGHRYLMSGRCADASGHKIPQGGQKLPPGYVLFPNAQGQNVPIKRAATYAQCMQNGRTLGYAESRAEAYCKEHHPR